MFDWKKSTVQMLGRWQPWHHGHQELFKRCIAKTGQVIIQVRDVKGASGGAGQPIDMVNVLSKGSASAVLAASIFHFGIYSIENVKKEMLKYNIPVRKTW